MDIQLIKLKFLSAKDYLVNMAEVLENYTVEEFKHNFSVKLQVERAFEVLNQIIIDICTHIISTYSENPENYANCIELMQRKDIIDEALSSDLIKSVRMRNLIVHQYAAIDYDILYSSISTIRNDFIDFKTQIIEWISNQDDD